MLDLIRFFEDHVDVFFKRKRLAKWYYFAERDLAVLLEFDARLHEEAGFIWYSSVLRVAPPVTHKILRRLWKAIDVDVLPSPEELHVLKLENDFFMRMIGTKSQF